LDPSFNASTTGSTGSVYGLAVMRNGAILVCGSNFSLGTFRGTFVRLIADGTRDPSFWPIVLGSVTAMGVQADGSMVIGGTFGNVENQVRNGLARYQANGTLDPNFGHAIDGAIAVNQPPVNTIVPTPDGRIIFGGTFSTFGGGARNGLARLVPPAPAITAQPVNTTVPVGANGTLSATVVGSALTYQWHKDGIAIPGATNATYSISGARVVDTGNYLVVAANSLGTVTSLPAALTVLLPPSIVTQPASVVVLAGLPATFALEATGTPAPGYQWQKDGTNLTGATTATFQIAATKAADAGVYRCVVTNSAGSVPSAAVTLVVLPTARLANVSVRTTLATADSIIVGFVVSGGTGDVLLRAAGPALAAFGVPTAMADPRLELYRDSTKLLENDNWPSVLTDAFAAVGAFPFLANSRDAALRQVLGGAHSAVASGSGAGVVLVEAYDLGIATTARLVNLSARNRVGTGDDVLIAGFSIGGYGSMRVLIRAIGPTLGGVPFNVPGVLADPRLELRNELGQVLATSNDWEPGLGPVFASVGAFGLAPGGKDAAVQATLVSNRSYTVVVEGADGGTGVALVEIYELP
jgi:hypothetical protein